MKPPPFEYFAPRSVDEALGLLAEHGDAAKALAGGQSLGPLLNMRLARPEVLVDLNRIAELAYLREEPGLAAGAGTGQDEASARLAREAGAETGEDGQAWLRIGALTRQRDVERSPTVAAGWPLLQEAVGWIGHTAIRNRGTLGGSLAHADPAAELPAVVTALNAELRLRGSHGQRWVTPGDFFLGGLTTCLAPDELLVEARLPPLPPGTGAAWQEFARRYGDFALVGVAAVLTLDARSGTCTAARLVYTGVGPVPFDAAAASRLVGQQASPELFAEAAEAAADCQPESDLHASAAYRRHLVRSLTRRALEQAAARAQAARPHA